MEGKFHPRCAGSAFCGPSSVLECLGLHEMLAGYKLTAGEGRACCRQVGRRHVAHPSAQVAWGCGHTNWRDLDRGAHHLPAHNCFAPSAWSRFDFLWCALCRNFNGNVRVRRGGYQAGPVSLYQGGFDHRQRENIVFRSIVHACMYETQMWGHNPKWQSGL